MIHLTVDPRANIDLSGCNVCCCQSFSVRPGETNKASINYAPWSVPTAEKGLACGTQIEISPCQNCSDPTGLQAGSSFIRSLYETPYSGDLSEIVLNPDSLNLKYVILSFYLPKYGQIELNQTTGQYTYTPNQYFKGIDSFFYSVEDIDGNVQKEIGEVVFAIQEANDTPLSNPGFTPDIDIPSSQINPDRVTHILSFPIEVSPAAKVGNIYRITIKQPALNCDCYRFYHESCYDIQVGKC